MLDQDKFKDPEELITCPYNIVHNVPRKRMTKHLSKCRLQNQELAKDMRVCEYNVSHRISKLEYELHKEECPDRETFYNHKFKVGNEPNEAVEQLNQNILKPLHVPCSEPSWEDEANPQQNILNTIVENAEQRGAWRNHSNEPPSVRKAKREEDRRKTRERINEEERSKFDPRTAFSSASSSNAGPSGCGLIDDAASTVSGASSMPSETTIRSESDASYQSAWTTATRMLDSFQVVENRRHGRGRSRAPTNEINPSQIGIGRGRRRQ